MQTTKPFSGGATRNWTEITNLQGSSNNLYTIAPYVATRWRVELQSQAWQACILTVELPSHFGAVHRIRTCKPFQANCFQGSSLTNPDRRHIIGSATQNWTGDPTVKGWWLDHLPIAPYLFLFFFFLSIIIIL